MSCLKSYARTVARGQSFCSEMLSKLQALLESALQLPALDCTFDSLFLTPALHSSFAVSPTACTNQFQSSNLLEQQLVEDHRERHSLPQYTLMGSQQEARSGQVAGHKPLQSIVSEPKATSVSYPYDIIREIIWSCKVIFLCFIGVSLVWIFAFGQPSKLLNLPAGIYQGFVCGWTSEVENPWTCDKE